MGVDVDQPGKEEAGQPDLGHCAVGGSTGALGAVPAIGSDRADVDDGVPFHLDHPWDQDPPGAVAGHDGVRHVADPYAGPAGHQGCAVAWPGTAASSSSITVSSARRAAWRPPSKPVARNTSTMSRASSVATTRAPRERTVASLWRRANRAVYSSWHSAALAPAHLVGGDLLALTAAADDDPEFSLAPHDPPGHVGADGRVVDRLGRVRPDVADRVALALEVLDDRTLQDVAGVVGADNEPHGQGSQVKRVSRSGRTAPDWANQRAACSRASSAVLEV